MQSALGCTPITGLGSDAASLGGLPANSSLAYKLDLIHPSILGVAQKGSEEARGTDEWKVLDTTTCLHVLYLAVLCEGTGRVKPHLYPPALKGGQTEALANPPVTSVYPGSPCTQHDQC